MKITDFLPFTIESSKGTLRRDLSETDVIEMFKRIIRSLDQIDKTMKKYLKKKGGELH